MKEVFEEKEIEDDFEDDLKKTQEEVVVIPAYFIFR